MTPKLWYDSLILKFVVFLGLLFATWVHVVLARPAPTIMPATIEMMENDEVPSFTQAPVPSPTGQPEEQYAQHVDDITMDEELNAETQREDWMARYTAAFLESEARLDRLTNMYHGFLEYREANPDFFRDLLEEPDLLNADSTTTARIADFIQFIREIGGMQTASAETESPGMRPTGENTNTNHRPSRSSGSCRPEDKLNLKKDDDDNDGSGFKPSKSGQDLGVGTSYASSEGKKPDSNEGCGVQDASKSSNMKGTEALQDSLSVLSHAVEDISKYLIPDSIYADQNPSSALSEYNQVQSQPLSYPLDWIPVA